MICLLENERYPCNSRLPTRVWGIGIPSKLPCENHENEFLYDMVELALDYLQLNIQRK